MRDTQRQKVYDWENRSSLIQVASKRLTLDGCRDLAEKAFAAYCLSAPSVIQGRGNRGGAWWLSFRNTIKLNHGAEQEWIVLHECAHGIVERFYDRFKNEYSAHGPEFVRVYINLLNKFLKIPLSELRSEARSANVKVATATKIEKPTKKVVSQIQSLEAKYKQKKLVLNTLENEFNTLIAPLIKELNDLNAEIVLLKVKLR